ncbi:hypothetical protein vseg_014083 [Gypsophila vaccaria]
MVRSGSGSGSGSGCKRFIQAVVGKMGIPWGFMKQMEGELEGEPLKTVVLMCEDEPHRHWLVCVEGGRYFSLGWNDFCAHLHLRIGDFLLFTYHSHFLFLVSVFDPLSACLRLLPSAAASSSLHPPPPPPPPPPLLPFPGASDTNTAANPIPSASSFLLRLTHYKILHSIFFLPVAFARENGLRFRRCQMMIIDGETREWPVCLNYKNCDGQSYIKRGFNRFITANHLKPGDDLFVQFLKGGTCPTLKCYRPHNTGKKSDTTCKSTPKKAPAEDITTSSSEQDQIQYLSCDVRLTSKKSIIYFPSHFVRESHLKCRTYEAKLVDEEERTWKVTLTCKSTSKAYICRGWREVQNANCFRPGNVVCFRLLEAGDRPIFKCYRARRRRRTRFSKARHCLVGAA